MKRDYTLLTNLILKKYGTFTAFSEATGYSNAAISQKLSGKTSLSLDDIDKWAVVLKIPRTKYGKYFF